jgi:hypothetical protein
VFSPSFFLDNFSPQADTSLPDSASCSDVVTFAPARPSQ